MEQAILDSIGKLSIEVVAIVTLAYLVYTQGKSHERMTKSIDRLTAALSKKVDRDAVSSKVIKKGIEKVHGSLLDHREWSKKTADRLVAKM